MRLAFRLREFREARGLTQGQLAMQMKMDRSYVTRIEHGQRIPALETAYRLARFFKCPLEDMIGLEPDTNSER